LELPPIRLTAIKVKNIKPTAKTQRFFDVAGLYLEVSPKGGKWWRYRKVIERMTESMNAVSENIKSGQSPDLEKM
jgi:hypothetical protein